MPDTRSIVTVSLNPTIDRVIEVKRFVLGEHQVGRELSRTPGGKGVNVSRVLAALGAPSVATGFLGRGSREDFAELLNDPLVTDRFVFLEGRTRENVTIVETSGVETHIRDAGLAVDRGSLVRLGQTLVSLAGPGVTVVFSGSLPPKITPADMVELVDRCNAAGARVAVDAAADALRAAVGRGLYLIKPNVEELSELTGEALDTPRAQLSAARNLTDRIELILLSRGAEGAYLIGPSETLHARPDCAGQAVRNTVGCGDVLLGAFLASIAGGEDLGEALRAAVAAASASACHLVPAMFDRQLAEALKANVRLEEI